MNTLPINRGQSGPQVHRFDAAATRFDTTLHSLSRWAGYATLCAAYVGVGCYLIG